MLKEGQTYSHRRCQTGQIRKASSMRQHGTQHIVTQIQKSAQERTFSCITNLLNIPPSSEATMHILPAVVPSKVSLNVCCMCVEVSLHSTPTLCGLPACCQFTCEKRHQQGKCLESREARAQVKTWRTQYLSELRILHSTDEVESFPSQVSPPVSLNDHCCPQYTPQTNSNKETSCTSLYCATCCDLSRLLLLQEPASGPSHLDAAEEVCPKLITTRRIALGS